VPMSAPSLAVSAVLIFSSMLASFSIPLMMGRGGGAQMLMIDVYYRFGQHGDFETAAALGTSPATVKRDWAFSRAWLNRELAGSGAGGLTR